MDYEDSPKYNSSRKSSKRKPSKVITRKKKSRDSVISDRLKENILKFRAEEQMMTVEETAQMAYAEPPNSLSTLSPDSSVPKSPKEETVSFLEQRAKIEAEVCIVYVCFPLLVEDCVGNQRVILDGQITQMCHSLTFL